MTDRISGSAFKQMIAFGAACVAQQKQAINDLNVFPVPDGDTGTNMSLTIQTAVNELKKSEPATVGEAAKITAGALLRGARGNSGVILSLLFRGISKSAKGLVEMDGPALAAAMGEGLIVVLAARKRESGASIEETCAWVEENKLHSCHWFTVESLKYLRRGGRISATSAVVGSLLDIKPVLHVDDEGHLIAMDKVRGMRAAVKSLIAHMRETWNGDPDSPVFINHADSPERAQELAERVRSEFGVREIVIEPLDLVIGAHSGPGTLALFFMGSKR